jgi:hypothetical protein
MRSTETGFAPGTTGGKMVCTCAEGMEPDATAIPNAIAQNNFAIFITVLSWKLVAIAFMQSETH